MDTWDRNKFTWAGEDEEKSVKDSWDQDSDEEIKKEEEERKAPHVSAPNSKKNLKQICKRYEEKERIKEAEAKANRERLRAELAAIPCITAADRMRRRRLQEGADLVLTKEVYGISEANTAVRPSS